MGADFALNGLITLLHSTLVFSKVKDPINICLASGSDIILFTADVNLYKISVKASFKPCILLVNDSILFLDSTTLTQAFKATIQHRIRVLPPQHTLFFANQHTDPHQEFGLGKSHGLALLHYSRALALSTKFSIVIEDQLPTLLKLNPCGIILLLIVHQFNICLTKGECIPYETMTSLTPSLTYLQDSN